VADTCLECTCAPVFIGCRAPGDPHGDCPALGCYQPECCRAEGDCALIGTCATPGTTWGCGICYPGPGDCTVDADCAPATTGYICEPGHCSCDGASQCVPGCTDASTCGDAEICDLATHRCEPRACTGPAGCPANFACGGAGRCSRLTCAGDAGCPDGWCVLGNCWDALGECRQPVP
jgi:hypothetical protein